MNTIIKYGRDKTTVKDIHSSIYEMLLALDISLPFPCSGNGTCGKCTVYIKGEANCITNDEETHLRKIKRRSILGFNARLACFCKAQGDSKIVIRKQNDNNQILQGSSYYLRYIGDNPNSYGISIDIGTTTIVAELYSFAGSKLVFSQAALNAQQKYGRDILARIESSNRLGVKALSDTLINQIRGMLNNCKAKAHNGQISRIVITGNTIMLHYLCRLDPKEIGAAPFTPKSLFGYDVSLKNIINADFDCKVYLPNCTEAYVGADITCGIISAGMLNTNADYLLADMGTSGELALKFGDRLISCSTAAGPAFEGGNIEQGMTASEGAIYTITSENSSIKCRTVGNKKAIGICGSGLISAVAFMLRENILDESGQIQKEGHKYTKQIVYDNSNIKFQLTEDVFLTQKDIRAVQLAKAAIAAGIDSLLKYAAVSYDGLESFYVAGGFGNFLNISDACEIGLFPKELENRIQSIGNASLNGATMMLFDEKYREQARYCTESSISLNLSESAYFMQQYIERMMFGNL